VSPLELTERERRDGVGEKPKEILVFCKLFNTLWVNISKIAAILGLQVYIYYK
jgi:hypothetical protein